MNDLHTVSLNFSQQRPVFVKDVTPKDLLLASLSGSLGFLMGRYFKLKLPRVTLLTIGTASLTCALAKHVLYKVALAHFYVQDQDLERAMKRCPAQSQIHLQLEGGSLACLAERLDMKFNQIEHLSLSHAQFTPLELQGLLARLPNLTQLTVNGNTFQSCNPKRTDMLRNGWECISWRQTAGEEISIGSLDTWFPQVKQLVVFPHPNCPLLGFEEVVDMEPLKDPKMLPCGHLLNASNLKPKPKSSDDPELVQKCPSCLDNGKPSEALPFSPDIVYYRRDKEVWKAYLVDDQANLIPHEANLFYHHGIDGSCKAFIAKNEGEDAPNSCPKCRVKPDARGAVLAANRILRIFPPYAQESFNSLEAMEKGLNSSGITLKSFQI